MSRKAKAMEATKENLINAFWTMVEQKPLETITVRDITLLAGYNRSTFYRYFDDMPALITYMEKLILPEQEITTIKNMIATKHIFMQDLTTIFLQTFKKQDAYHVSIFMKSQYVQEHLKTMLRPILISLLHTTAQHDDYIEYEAEYILSGILNIYSLWYERHSNDTDLEDFIKMITNVMFFPSLTNVDVQNG